MTPEAVGKILEVHEAANNPFLPFEDIYVTGVLARAAGVSIINFEEKIFTNYLGKERFIIHKGLSHWKPNYIENRWADTVINALGNDTYLKMKEMEANQKTLENKQFLVKQLVAKKRKLFFQNKKKQSGSQNEMAEEIKNKNGTLTKKREQALKKPIQPYMF